MLLCQNQLPNSHPLRFVVASDLSWTGTSPRGCERRDRRCKSLSNRVLFHDVPIESTSSGRSTEFPNELFHIAVAIIDVHTHAVSPPSISKDTRVCLWAQNTRAHAFQKHSSTVATIVTARWHRANGCARDLPRYKRTWSGQMVAGLVYKRARTGRFTGLVVVTAGSKQYMDETTSANDSMKQPEEVIGDATIGFLPGNVDIDQGHHDLIKPIEGQGPKATFSRYNSRKVQNIKIVYFV